MKLKEKMLRERESAAVYKQAQRYAFEYDKNIGQRHVYPTAAALQNLKIFDEDLPPTGSDAATVIDLLGQHGSPATVAQNAGRYFGFVNGGALPVTLAARWLADFWDQNAALAVMSPISAQLETVTEKWLRQLLHLPDETAAAFVSGTSVSIICALAAARYRLLKNAGWDVNQNGLHNAPPLRIVAGEQMHAAVARAVALLGFGAGNIEAVPCDEQGRVIAAKMPALDSRCIVILQAGNVNGGAFDPFAEICPAARAAGAWVHIDGAFGLWAAACKSLSSLTAGMQQADSWSTDAHKTLNVPYDCGIVLCRDRAALDGAFAATAAYLPCGDGRDGMRYTPEMSRRARVVELWAALKYLGAAGVDELVCDLHQNATALAAQLSAHGFTILNQVVFNQIVICADDDTTTQRILQNIQAGGNCWAGATHWQGKTAIRLSLCAWSTTPTDISQTTQAFTTAIKSATKN